MSGVSFVSGMPEHLTMFEKCTLIQLCFGCNEVILHFYPEGLYLRIEGELQVAIPEAAGQIFADFAAAAPALLSLLDGEVQCAQSTEKAILTLVFSGDRKLVVYPSEAPYESYAIGHGDVVYVI